MDRAAAEEGFRGARAVCVEKTAMRAEFTGARLPESGMVKGEMREAKPEQKKRADRWNIRVNVLT
jgi:hypothetical protein